MSKQTRPLSHQIGDIACAQISSLFFSQGWVVNPVLRDYGEDLVVQICQEGRLTPCSIHVQVKGTRSLDRFERSSYFSYGKLKRSTVNRWLQSNDIVMLVLWSINAQDGIYGFITDLFEREQLESNRPFVTARIPKTSVLSKASINKVRVQALLKWDLLQCRMAEAQWSMAKIGMATYHSATSELVHAGLNYLLTLDVIIQVGNDQNPSFKMNPVFWSDFAPVLDQMLYARLREEKLAARKLEEALEEAFKDSILITLVKRVNRAGSGAEYSMLHAGAEVLEVLLSDVIEKSKRAIDPLFSAER